MELIPLLLFLAGSLVSQEGRNEANQFFLDKPRIIARLNCLDTLRNQHFAEIFLFMPDTQLVGNRCKDQVGKDRAIEGGNQGQSHGWGGSHPGHRVFSAG